MAAAKKTASKKKKPAKKVFKVGQHQS